jgi:putrescine transport system substrate-binding protein
VRPYVTNFNNMQANELAGGDVCVVLGWSGDISQAAVRAEEAKNGVRIKYAIPREGTEVWIDTMAIPKDAPHPGNALLFIDYIMRPEVAAKITNFVAYPSGNAAALKNVLPEIASNPAIYPGPELRSRLYTVPVMPDNVDRMITRSWTRMKTGQ